MSEKPGAHIDTSGGGGYKPFHKADVQQSLGRRFEEQVYQHPQRLAIASRDRSLTYTEFDAEANRVVDLLVSLNAVPEAPIALLMEDDSPLVAAMLGVLKLGRVFVTRSRAPRRPTRVHARGYRLQRSPD